MHQSAYDRKQSTTVLTLGAFLVGMAGNAFSVGIAWCSPHLEHVFEERSHTPESETAPGATASA